MIRVKTAPEHLDRSSFTPVAHSSGFKLLCMLTLTEMHDSLNQYYPTGRVCHISCKHWKHWHCKLRLVKTKRLFCLVCCLDFFFLIEVGTSNSRKIFKLHNIGSLSPEKRKGKQKVKRRNEPAIIKFCFSSFLVKVTKHTDRQL